MWAVVSTLASGLYGSRTASRDGSIQARWTSLIEIPSYLLGKYNEIQFGRNLNNFNFGIATAFWEFGLFEKFIFSIWENKFCITAAINVPGHICSAALRYQYLSVHQYSPILIHTRSYVHMFMHLQIEKTNKQQSNKKKPIHCYWNRITWLLSST